MYTVKSGWKPYVYYTNLWLLLLLLLLLQLLTYLLSFIVSVLTLYDIHCNYSLAATLQLLLGYFCNCFNAGVAISCQNYSHLKQYFQ